MKRLIAISAAILLSTLVMGAGGSGGCDDDIPSIQTVELNVPDSLRHCPNAPVSPGASATKAQTSRYIIALYYAWKTCKGNNEQFDALYVKYRARLESYAKK